MIEPTEQQRVLLAMAMYAAYKVVKADPSGMLELACEQVEVEAGVIAAVTGLDEDVVVAALDNLDDSGYVE